MVFTLKGAFLFYFEIFNRASRTAFLLQGTFVVSCCFLIWRLARGSSLQREVCSQERTACAGALWLLKLAGFQCWFDGSPLREI